jgi:TRAP-type C4-dicarboxylate transport system permease small subunit
MPPKVRLVVTLFSEAVVFTFFILLARTGIEVMVVLGGEHRISLEWVPQRLTTSVIPIGAVLFIIAEAMRMPKLLRDARGAGFIDTETIEAISHGAPDAGADTGAAR